MTDSLNPGQPMRAARFALGSLVATPGALRELQRLGIDPLSLIARHVSGDFGQIDEHDKHVNEEAIRYGYRVLSAYTLSNSQSPNADCIRIWCITEADRSVTTVLRPEDY